MTDVKDYSSAAEALASALGRAAQIARDPDLAGVKLFNARFGQRKIAGKGFYFILDFRLEFENDTILGEPAFALPDLWLHDIVSAWEQTFEVRLKTEELTEA